MMSDNIIEKIKSATDDTKLNSACDDIVSDIKGRTITVLDVVTSLAQFLTSEDVSQREHGVHSLSTILSKLPKDFLTHDELKPITLFYCDRLKDHYSVIPAVIRGIATIVQMKNLPEDAPFKLLTALFRDIRCQSENPRTRRVIYAIFETLLSTKIKELQAMGPDLIYGIISSIDGESDPTSLDLIFKTLPKILKDFELGHLTEEMFEILACYFPVDFQTEGRDGTGITRNDLVHGLEECLSSTAEFAEFCLPLLIEKLDSSLKTAKIDSLNVLARAACTYGATNLAEHPDLWSAIRKEILPGSDEEIKTIGLKTVTAITRAFTNDDRLLKVFIDRVCDDSKWCLNSEDKNLFWAAEKMLEAVGKASAPALRQVLKVIVPLCLGQYSTKTTEIDKVCLMETLNNFIACASTFGFQISDVPELAWTDIPSLYLNELLSNTEGNSLKVKVFDGLTIQKLSLNESHRKTLYTHICEEIDSGNPCTKSSCHTTLTVFAQLHPAEILHIVQTDLNINNNQSSTRMKHRLEALTSIAKITELAPNILPIILLVAVSDAREIATAGLGCLQKLLNTQKCNFNIADYLYNNCNAIDELLKATATDNCLTETIQRHIWISNVCRLIIRRLNEEDQKNIILKHIHELREYTERNVLLLEGILTPLMPANISNEVIDMLDSLVTISLESTEFEMRISSARLIAVIINKISDDDRLTNCLNKLRDKISNILESQNDVLTMKKAAIILHTWITKAVTTRGCKKSQDFLNYQLDMLRDGEIGEYAGDSFRIFVDKDERSLIIENFCTIKIFYKQRILQNVLGRSSEFANDCRSNYLIALINLIEEMPLELLFLHLKKLVPLLIESLLLNNSTSILSTLKILKLLLNTKHEVFIEQIQCFIPRCLKLSTYPEMNVRIAALNCLTSYCNYPVVKIKPYKDDVIEKLSETLDDKKRLVRQMAVTTRTRWFLVGAPGEPE